MVKYRKYIVENAGVSQTGGCNEEVAGKAGLTVHKIDPDLKHIICPFLRSKHIVTSKVGRYAIISLNLRTNLEHKL